MSAIASPKPRRATRVPSSSRPLLSPRPPPSSNSLPAESTTGQHNALSSSRLLLSPIELVDDTTHSCPLPKSPPCNTIKSTIRRRRRATSPLPRASRRRHCTNTDCFIKPFGGPALFDGLSWISALESAPELASTWDTADLSLLVMDHFIEDKSPSTGPVRSRKSSMRQDPLSNGNHSAPERYPSQSIDEHVLHTLLPFDGRAVDPRTPPPEPFIPSQIRFHGLYPILPLDCDESWRPMKPDSN